MTKTELLAYGGLLPIRLPGWTLILHARCTSPLVGEA